jgi:hypothetical protein
MNTDTTLYVTQLKAISASKEGNAYLKKWAQLWLKEIKYQTELTSRSRETLIRLNFLTMPKSS